MSFFEISIEPKDIVIRIQNTDKNDFNNNKK
jgi:hypothetical protein